jgi:hypothetical protein
MGEVEVETMAGYERFFIFTIRKFYLFGRLLKVTASQEPQNAPTGDVTPLISPKAKSSGALGFIWSQCLLQPGKFSRRRFQMGTPHMHFMLPQGQTNPR